MNWSSLLHNPIRVLGSAAAVGAAAVAAVSIPPSTDVAIVESRPSDETIEAPDANLLNERIPEIGEVLEKHLFVAGREATGQNSFPDLVVKGTYVGDGCNVVLSLKSNPQANLTVWLGEVEDKLNSITDARDARRNLVTFLREWPIKEITKDGIKVAHYITGEVETYTVDYVTQNKVADDAQRGYGQGIMPQTGTTTAVAAQNRPNPWGQPGQPGQGPSPEAMMNMMREAGRRIMGGGDPRQGGDNGGNGGGGFGGGGGRRR